jgi:tetratricopeptide (TPR) repeat protein
LQEEKDMNLAQFVSHDGIPSVAFRPEGGVLTWQDWMCDNLALMGSPRSDGTVGVRLFSFNSGQTLGEAALSSQEAELLRGSDRYLLETGELGDDLRWEAMMVKHEPCDLSGDLIAGIQAQSHGDLESAAAAYQRVRQRSPKLPRVANLLGLCLRLTGNVTEAEQAYLQETELMPQIPDAFCNLGILYLKTEREQLARTMFEKALDRDQFYLNALLQSAKMLAGHEKKPSRLAASLNLRLLTIYHDIPQVQEHLMKLATNLAMSAAEFSAFLRNESGVLSDPPFLLLMRRVESLRLNGAYLATMRGFAHLLRKAEGTPLETFSGHWTARRLAVIEPFIPPPMQPAWRVAKQELVDRLPAGTMAETGEATTVAEPPTRTTELTAEEFFEMALFEIMRDGQIKPFEAQILFRLKNALRIDEETHQRLFHKVEARLHQNPLVDDGQDDFQGERLFRQLVMAVLRDGRVEPQEKKLLTIAAESLELPAAEVRRIIAEVQS